MKTSSGSAAVGGTADVTVLGSHGLSGAEAATALGLAHALRGAGLQVCDEGGARAAVMSLAFAPLAGVDEVLRRAGDAARAVVVPLLRDAAECGAWLLRKDRVRAFWTTSRELAAYLKVGGAQARWVGVSAQLGAVRHHSRRALGLREQDLVFVVLVDDRVTARTAGCLREAWERRSRDPSTRYAKASLLVLGATEGSLVEWRRWADRPDLGAVTVERQPADPLLLGALLETADCELLCDEVTAGGLAPAWTAAATLFAGKPVLLLGEREGGLFGAAGLPHVTRLAAGDGEGLAAAMQRVVEMGGGWRGRRAGGARQMLPLCSARAVGVRAVESLRAVGLWDEFAASSG